MDAEMIKWLREDLSKLEIKLDGLGQKVDELLQFKFKVIGGTILASLILTAAFQVMLAFIQK